MRAATRTLGAIGLGLALAALPFVRYRWAGSHPGAHGDHAPRHGGILGMVGDVHLEVVRRPGRIEVYPSDAYRRPLVGVGGFVRHPTGRTIPLEPREDRLVAVHGAGTPSAVTCRVLLEGGRIAELDVEF